MDWELKKEFARLGNCSTVSDENRKSFQDFVLKNIENFDVVDWSFFIELSTINVDEMIADIEYWRKVYPYLNAVDWNDRQYQVRAGIRIAIIQTICKDELYLLDGSEVAK